MGHGAILGEEDAASRAALDGVLYQGTGRYAAR
jgi:hypothetical protein